ncbi:MAG TPA: hypothetical protein VNT03_21875 [Baekduia sp.]|nr:hypothetical protein [Baekduia sp.]
MAPALYLLPAPAQQRETLALQSRVWEPAARALLDDLELPAAPRTLRIGWSDQQDVPLPTDAGTFDLVHARFQLALGGRPREQLDAYRRLVTPGGLLVVEEPDTRSLVYEPYAPASTHLVGRVAQVLRASGGDLDAGRRLPDLMRGMGLAPQVRTHVLGLEAGHPYLRLPLDLADRFADRLADVLGGDVLAHLRRESLEELAAPGRRGTTLTLVQAWARV